jgi:hypothetical protein
LRLKSFAGTKRGGLSDIKFTSLANNSKYNLKGHNEIMAPYETYYLKRENKRPS